MLKRGTSDGRRCYLGALAAGGMLALTVFVPIWWVQLLALPALGLVFGLLRAAPVKLAYRVGLVFCLAWLLPTTYWYYSFMSPLVAFAASAGYDMHYPDIVGRLRGADAAYASLDNATYGYLQKQLHTADIALHAAQAGVASTSGPTFAVDARGVVRQQVTGSGPTVLVVR